VRFPDTVAILRAAGTDAYGNPGASWDTPETVATVAGFLNGKRDTCYLPATAPVLKGDRLSIAPYTYAIDGKPEPARSPSRVVLIRVKLTQLEGS
jgi:hypothetical protein